MTENDTKSTRDAATMIALICLILGSASFVGFAALVMPQLLGLFLVVGLFLGAVALHYIVWGWWLTAMLKSDETEALESSLADDAAHRSSVDGA